MRAFDDASVFRRSSKPPCCTNSILAVFATSDSATLTLSARIRSMSIDGAALAGGYRIAGREESVEVAGRA